MSHSFSDVDAMNRTERQAPMNRPGADRNLASQISQLEKLVGKLSEQVDRLHAANGKCGGAEGSMVGDLIWIGAVLLVILIVTNVVLFFVYRKRMFSLIAPQRGQNVLCTMDLHVNGSTLVARQLLIVYGFNSTSDR